MFIYFLLLDRSLSTNIPSWYFETFFSHVYAWGLSVVVLLLLLLITILFSVASDRNSISLGMKTFAF